LKSQLSQARLWTQQGPKAAAVRTKIGSWVQARTKDRLQFSALHFAAMHGNLYMLRLLLSKGGDILARSSSGVGLMHVAA